MLYVVVLLPDAPETDSLGIRATQLTVQTARMWIHIDYYYYYIYVYMYIYIYIYGKEDFSIDWFGGLGLLGP